MTRYTICLFIVLVCFACKRPAIVPVVPVPERLAVTVAKEMAGERHWEALYTYHDPGIPALDTSYALPDTTFAIVYAGDSTVSIGHIAFVHRKFDTANARHLFGIAMTVPRGMEPVLWCGDSWIVYTVPDGGLGGGSAITYTTVK